MTTPRYTDPYLVRLLDNLPLLDGFVRSRGPSFLVFWAHRISGLILVLYLLFHLLTLSSLADPAVFRSKMAGFDTLLFALLEFILAVPLLFHAFNGTRLILYESFGCRNDTHLLHWLGSLGLVYLLLLGVLMGMGSQSISPSLFGMVLPAIGLVATAYSAQKIR